jgi:VanZ family protein
MFSKIISKRMWMLLALVWSILIFIGCSLPSSNLPKLSVWDHFDKVVHFVLFGVCTFLWHQSIAKYLLGICVAVIFYGIAIEFYQEYFVPSRSFDVWDIVADVVGVAVAMFASRRLNRLA